MLFEKEPKNDAVVTPITLEEPPQGGVRVALGVNESVGAKV